MNVTKLALIASISLLFLATVSAESDWNVNALDEPYALTQVSNNTQTVQVINLTTDNGTPINESQLEGRAEYNYTDNFDEKHDLTWLSQGYWFAEFETSYWQNDTNDTTEVFGNEVIFEAQGETESSQIANSPGTEANDTKQLDIGNIDVNMLNDLSEAQPAGQEVNIEVNLTDEVNNVDEENAEVKVYFTDIEWSSGEVELGYNTDKELYTNTVTFPEETNSTFFMHIEAENDEATYDSPYGSQSIVLETLPAIQGEISELNTDSGCNQDSFFTACERGAEISTEFEITASEAENVNLSLMYENRSNGELVEDEVFQMERDEEIFSTNFTFPEINTTEYTDELALKYNATNEEREYVEYYNITSEAFSLGDRINPTATQGVDHEIEILIAKPFSMTPLTHDRFREGEINVTDSEGEQLTSFTLDDMEYDTSTDYFTNTVNISGDAPTGTYDVNLEIENIYGETQELNSGFSVQEINATFSTVSEIDLFTRYVDDYSTSIEVENLMNSEIVLVNSVTGELEDIASVNESVTLQDSETLDLIIDFAVDHVDNYEGELLIEDNETGYNYTVDLELEAPPHGLRNGSLGLLRDDEWLNVTAEEAGEITEEVDLMYMGENQTETIDISVQGDVGQYLSAPSVVETDDSEIIELVYDANVPGNFTGSVVFEAGNDTLELKTALESTVEPQNPGISVPQTIDLGYNEQGVETVYEADIENTGDVDINSVSVSSDEYDVTTDSLSISAGETETLELEFNSLDFETGSLTFTGETPAGEVSDTANIETVFIDDMESDIENLRDRITTLSINAEDSNIQDQVQDLEIELTTMETEFQSGNYESAFNDYDDIESTVETLEAQVDTSENNVGDTSPQEPEQPDDSDLPILPIALGFGILLLIGFVAYESVIPEEGDPLYDVLGR